MTHDIIGEWELSDPSKAAKGKEAALGSIVFLEQDGKVVVKSADPDVTDKPSRVEFEGDTIRFEMLSAGSSRGNSHQVYEISLHGPYAFGGTRRQGLLPKAPVTGQRIGEPAAPVPADAPETPTAATYATADLSTSVIAMPGSVAEAKAKAAEAAERASIAAAEAAAALAEAEAAAALEAARRAAENAAAARAAIQTPPTAPPAMTGQVPVAQPPVTAQVPQQPLATPEPQFAPAPLPMQPAPAEPAPQSTFMPQATTGAVPAPITFESASGIEDTSTGAAGKRRLRITHWLTREDHTTLAAEAFPGVFVWGNSFVTTEQRLREVGWSVTPFATDETLEVDDLVYQHAAMVRDSFAR